MKHLLVIQAESKLPSLAGVDGDFSEWIVDGMEINGQTTITTVEAPEFTAEIAQGYLDYYRPALLQRGVDVDALSRRVRDYPYGRMQLQRFAALTSLK